MIKFTVTTAIVFVSCSILPNHTNADVNFLIFGDSGNIQVAAGKSGLLPVANAMKSFCSEITCDFALMAGDNIYENGADGSILDVDRFSRAFAEPYGDWTSKNSNFRIYMALGNHDWRTSRAGAFAQINYAEQNAPLYMDGPFYKTSLTIGRTSVDIFVIDTEMILSETILDRYSLNASGMPVRNGKTRPGGQATALPQTNSEKNQLTWLKTELAASTAQWKFVLAHHPFWESRGSKHEELIVLRKLLRPTVCEFADAYFAGHQHTLEVYADSCKDVLSVQRAAPLLHVVSGAASKSRSINEGYMDWQANTFPNLIAHWAQGDHWGYVHGEITNNTLKVTVFSKNEKSESSDKFTPVTTYVLIK